MRPKPVAYFLCAVSLLLIVVCPLILLTNNHIEAEAIPYKGILTLWHIARWRTGGSSFESFLSKRIKAFEANYAYAFIELKSLTADEALGALEAGETPDLISYPLGLDMGVKLHKMPFADTILPDTGRASWPYTCGGYCILVNTDLLTEQGAPIPEDGWGIRPEALTAAAKFGVCFDAEAGGSALPALALHQYPESQEKNYSTWEQPEPPAAILSLMPQELEDGLNSFLEGKAAVLVASQRQLYEAQRAYMEGSGPAFFAYAIGGYTDTAQMIGVAASDDKKKLSACETFARSLLTNSAQRGLEALGTMPVVPNLEIYAEDECRRAMYTMLCEHAVMPQAHNAQDLNNLAAKALGKDADALNELITKLGR